MDFGIRDGRGRCGPGIVPFILIAVPLTIIACGSGESSDTSGPQVVEVEGTAQTVVDPEISQVMDAVEDADGTLWVLSAHPPFVRSYGSDGQAIAAFDQTGEGPGEFGLAQFLVPPPDGPGMGVFDSQRGYLHHYRADGMRLDETTIGRSMPLPHEVRFAFFGDLGRVWRTEGGVVQELPPAFAGGATPYDYRRGTLAWFGEGDPEPRTVGRMADFAGIMVSDEHVWIVGRGSPAEIAQEAGVSEMRLILGSRTWDRWEKGGEFVETIEFLSRFAPVEFSEDAVLGIYYDEFGREQVAVAPLQHFYRSL